MGSLSILEKDKIVFSKAYGLAELSSGKKLDPTTKLKIGSITKTFTATMIMQLADEKKLSLDTKLSQFYPKVVNADKITIAMLLHHRTGIPDYINDDPTVVQYIYTENKKADLLKRIEGYTSAFEPDSEFRYSNSNYNLLGYILEDITKKSYAENLNTRIVKKLGLKNTSFPVKIEPSQNEGYSFTFNGTQWEKTPEWNNSMAFAAGAIASTPDDLNLFLSGLFNGKLVSAASLEQMKTMKDNYGKGLVIAPFEERKFYGHTGGNESFRAAAGYNPEEKTGFCIVVNGDNFNRNDIMIGVLSLFYGKDYQFPDVKGFAVSETLLAKYVGTYSSKSIPIKITIAENDGQLTAQATGQSAFPLTATSETEFVFETAGIQMVFGDQKMLLKQGGMEFEFTKG
jgi:CubicO group peptidase (beta-lactamase class C family)